MPELSSPTLSAHEILRFSRDQAGMRVQNVGLYNHRLVISLRDCARQDLWELANLGSRLRLTRFPERYPLSFEGRLGSSSEGTITRELYARVVAAHRPAIVALIRNLIAEAMEARVRASGMGAEDARAMDDRLKELRRVLRHLVPGDVPE